MLKYWEHGASVTTMDIRSPSDILKEAADEWTTESFNVLTLSMRRTNMAGKMEVYIQAIGTNESKRLFSISSASDDQPYPVRIIDDFGAEGLVELDMINRQCFTPTRFEIALSRALLSAPISACITNLLIRITKDKLTKKRSDK